MATDETSIMPTLEGFACGACDRGVIFIPHALSNRTPASMHRYKIKVLPVLCGSCEDITMKIGISITRPCVKMMTEDEVKTLPAFKRMQSLPNAEVVADPYVAALGVLTVASIGQDFKRGCDIVSPNVSGSTSDYMFSPPPASFF
ncbi:hypothetical protein VE03_02087 [Pseudogymnoascus sp. 23342-1-I1]|nr:hypothetical protein VE03_02087 [Pseudogymnoascus sp. 23342-1-I1]